jgi:hypothetical protein
MSDIVERLRHCSENCGDEYLHELTGKAADTITRLTAEIDLLAILATDREEYLQLLTDENNKLRSVLQRVRRWGSPMIRGYIDGSLGRQAGGSDPLADDQVGSVGEQGAQG